MVLVACLVALQLGCGDDGATSGASAGFSAPLPARTLVTADWLSGSLSFVDRDRIAGAASTRTDVLDRTLDLSAYVPGPFVLEVTPDASRLLVLTSAGFFGAPGASFLLGETGGATIPMGRGKFLIIDLRTGRISKELETGDTPSAVAVTPDSKRAFVAHFGSGDIAVVDLDQGVVTQTVAVGRLTEELALDDTGSVGMVGFSTDGSARTFSTADLAGSLTTIQLEGDSAGIAFFPGTKVAFMVQAPNPLSFVSGYSVIDVQDPKAPKVLADVRDEDTLFIAYPALPLPKRKTVLVPGSEGQRLKLREYSLADGVVALRQTIEVGDAELLSVLGISYDGEDTVSLAYPRQRVLIRTNLATKESRTLAWEQSALGPADVVELP
ncbi:MAG TPA: hypothetical protein VFX59_00355 [Polyangiales bacterium]|nr:hypothetical protein [Polyangiales bacterium]